MQHRMIKFCCEIFELVTVIESVIYFNTFHDNKFQSKSLAKFLKQF